MTGNPLRYTYYSWFTTGDYACSGLAKGLSVDPTKVQVNTIVHMASV